MGLSSSIFSLNWGRLKILAQEKIGGPALETLVLDVMTATIETISKKIDGQTTKLPTATNTTTGDFF